MASSKRNFPKAIDDAREAYDNALDEIAEQISKDVVIPACKKYKLNFLVGNGDFFFCSPSGNDRSISQGGEWESYLGKPLNKTMQKYFQGIFNILNTKTGYDQYIGYYLESVYYEDL